MVDHLAEPSLFDRLIDRDPGRSTDYSPRLSRAAMQDILLRDLSVLLSALQFENFISLDDFPAVRKAVLNFGIKSYLGVSLEGGARFEIQKDIKEAIKTFEPRVDPKSLEVTMTEDDSNYHDGTISIRISAEANTGDGTVPIELIALIDPHTGTIEPDKAGQRG